MRDWKAIAEAYGYTLAGKDLSRLVQPLEKLEESFRPLTQNLSPDLEPSVEFRVEAGIE